MALGAKNGKQKIGKTKGRFLTQISLNYDTPFLECQGGSQTISYPSPQEDDL